MVTESFVYKIPHGLYTVWTRSRTRMSILTYQTSIRQQIKYKCTSFPSHSYHHHPVSGCKMNPLHPFRDSSTENLSLDLSLYLRRHTSEIFVVESIFLLVHRYSTSFLFLFHNSSSFIRSYGPHLTLLLLTFIC